MNQPDRDQAAHAEEHYRKLIAAIQGTQIAEVWYRFKHEAGANCPPEIAPAKESPPRSRQGDEL